MPARKVHTGVSLEEDVIEYLDLLARQQQRTRSFIINSIVRQRGDFEQIVKKPEDSLTSGGRSEKER